MAYEDSLNEHGVPSWVAQDGHRVWEVDELVDHVSSILAKASKEYEGREHDPGLRFTLREKVTRPRHAASDDHVISPSMQSQ